MQTKVYNTHILGRNHQNFVSIILQIEEQLKLRGNNIENFTLQFDHCTFDFPPYDELLLEEKVKERLLELLKE